MAALTDDVKAFVVQALACFDTPTQVANAVKEEFGLEITRMQVSTYDPTKFMGRNLSKKWREIFDATREAFLRDQATIPIANQNFRLRALDRLYQNAASRGNAALAAQLLEQAAKEAGGSFTNRREMTGKDGAPLLPTNPQEMTDEQLAAIAAGGSARTSHST